MKEIYEKLRKLQDVLAQMFAIEDKKKDIPRALEDKEAMLQKSKIAYLELHEKSERVNDEIASYRERLDNAEKDRIASEQKMDTITTAREFETLNKEIADLKESATNIRKSLITKEDYYRQLQDKITLQEQVMNDQTAEVDEEKAIMEKQIAECDAELDKVEAVYNELSEGIDADLLFKFKRIIRNKDGVGIVPIHNFICDGCHMQLPAQFVNDVRKDDSDDNSSIHYCPYCSRILFYEESDENSDIAAQMTERQDDVEDAIIDSGDAGSAIAEAGEFDEI